MMRHRWKSWIEFLGAIISASLPEGRFKELLRHYFWRRFDPLYALNKIISKAELLQDGILFVELDNGTKLYGLRDKASSRRVKLIAPHHELGKMKAFEDFVSILDILYEQYVEGTYEKYYEPKRGDTVVDAGANIGSFTVKAAEAVGRTGKVIAIEPEANNLKLLQRNIEANGLRNVVIVPKGVWSTKDELKLSLSRQTMGHSFYRKHYYETDRANEIEDVEVDTLDNMLRESGITRVDFIKMDIEGAEIEALKGMDEVLRSDVKLAIEVRHIVDGKRTDKTIIPQLREKGFEVHREGGIVYARKKA